MKTLQYVLGAFAVLAGVNAQGQFGQPENSAAVLAALRTVDNSTKASAAAARAFQPNNPTLRQDLVNANIVLRANWQSVIFTAQSAVGFYTTGGSQAIIDYINNVLFPDTARANLVYTNKRNVFVRSGFIDFINPGLLELRTAVDAAGSAVQVKTTARNLQAISVAFTQIELSYAQTQQTQQFGPGGEP